MPEINSVTSTSSARRYHPRRRCSALAGIGKARVRKRWITDGGPQQRSASDGAAVGA
jgi:hypothetical protein